MAPTYPTPLHAAAASSLIDFFSKMPETEAIILVGSCARGTATQISDVDVAVLVRATQGAQSSGLRNQWNDDRLAALLGEWQAFATSQESITQLEAAVPWSAADPEIIDGNFAPGSRGWTSWPDPFELEIGNYLVYGEVLWSRGTYLDELTRRWLPYYDDELRRMRLTECIRFGINNLDHVQISVERGLFFHAFDRLYHSIAEFLQGIFITRRVYPIAYNKWIREQIEGILGLPKLYEELVSLLSISDLVSDELAVKSARLRNLFSEYVEDVPK